MALTANCFGVTPFAFEPDVNFAGTVRKNQWTSAACASTLMATISKPRAAHFACISFIHGNDGLHGPHHGAQKSIYNTQRLSKCMSSVLVCVAIIIGGNGAVSSSAATPCEMPTNTSAATIRRVRIAHHLRALIGVLFARVISDNSGERLSNFLTNPPDYGAQSMNYFQRCKSTLAIVLAATLALQPLTSWSAIHPLSFLKTDSPTLQTFDLSASTDFDYDANPPSLTGGQIELNRAYVTGVFAEAAQFMFTMTEGRHRTGTVYVFRNNRFASNVDIKLMGLTPGRSNAHAAGWQKRGRVSTNFVTRMDNVDRSAVFLGKVVAHEHGHYLYGLYDEYREGPKPVADPPRRVNPRFAQSTDTPIDTLMNSQNRFNTFSTPGDYTDDVVVAQRRAHGASAWETLSRPQSADPASIQNLQRTAFAALSGFLPLSQAALTKPVDGWDAAFNVVFVPDPSVVDVYVIARKLTAEQLSGVKNSVIESLRQEPLAASTRVSIVTFPGTTLQPLTALDSEASRSAAIALVEAITPDTATGDITQTLDGVLADLTTRFTDKSIKLGDSIALHVVAGSEDRIAAATRDQIRELRLALNASVITADAAAASSTSKRSVAVQDLAKSAMRAKEAKAAATTVSLSQLAHASGGHFNDANRVSALTAGVTRSKHATAGLAEAPLTTDYVASLAAGAKFDLKTPVLAKTDGKLTFVATWASDADNGKLRYDLAAPDGARFAPTDPTQKQTFNTPAGEVRYSFDGSANSARFEVSGKYVTRNGEWTSTVSAAALVTQPVDQTATADSVMLAEIEVINDGTPNAVLEVSVSSDRPVEGAVVKAVFYGADGKISLTRTLFDDGTNGDEQADDGTYTVQLAGLLEAGQYDVVATVNNSPSNTAAFSTRGTTELGVDAAPEKLGGAFSRSVDTLLTMAPTTVYEYYVPAINKYFMTGREPEKLTLGQYPASFKQTGMSFIASLGSAPPAGTVSICRYYFAPPSLPNTHFYGDPTDCAIVAEAFSKNPDAKNEGIDFAIAKPDAAGNCPASAPIKIYRSFNNRVAQNDGNHRYTVSTTRYDQMAVAGWSRDGAVMCAASATDAAK